MKTFWKWFLALGFCAVFLGFSYWIFQQESSAARGFKQSIINFIKQGIKVPE